MTGFLTYIRYGYMLIQYLRLELPIYTAYTYDSLYKVANYEKLE